MRHSTGLQRLATTGRTGVSAAAILLTATVAAADEAPKWGAHLDLEGKAGTERNLGEADLLVPLARDADTLLFGNARFRGDDADGLEGNVGLGLRHMLPRGWILGGDAYFDRRRSDTRHYYSQVTVGAEALGRDFDLRANAYLPVGTRSHDLGTSGGGDPYARLAGTTVEVVTPGGTRTEERALSGFDAEVG